MARLPKSLEAQYGDLRKRYFPGLPPPGEVTLRYVPWKSEGSAIDTRAELACVFKGDKGEWVIEIDETLRDYKTLCYPVLAHEMLHMELGLDFDHRSKEWKRGVRKLQGLGFFLRTF